MSEATATKEHPILFSGDMVRAILDDRKTVTRRIVKGPFRVRDDWPYRVNPEVVDTGELLYERQMKSPYGRPGDRLWVREAWRRPHVNSGTDLTVGQVIQYRATSDWHDGFGESWRPSIHMPRWASRITLEVVSVRVERLQEITHEDALMEGCEGYDWVSSSPYISGPHTDSGELPREEFAALWDQLNADRGYSWDSNPWVWRVEFKRVEGK